MRFIIFLVALIFPASEVFPQPCDYWPTGQWQTKTLVEVNMDSTWIMAMDEVIMQNYSHLHSLLIVKDGYLVFEKYYYPGYGEEDYHILCSATKSITSILIGMLLKQGFIDSLEHRIIDYFPEYSDLNDDPRLNDLTIEHMLTFTSGLDHDDDYEWQTEDIIETYLGRDFVADPGAQFNYETPASQVLSAIVNKTTGQSAYAFACNGLFPKLGISNVYWPADGLGYSYGGFNSYFTPRDMLKIGFLYLNKGIWDADTMVNPDYVATSTMAHTDGGNPHKEKYGYNWWVTTIDGHHTFFAGGYGGQFILVVPDLDLVVVTTSGLDKHHEENRFLVNNYIVPAIEPVVSVSQDEGNHNILLYPNPANDILYVQNNVIKITEIQIFSVTGQIMGTYPSPTKINLNWYDIGVYFVVAKLQNGKVVNEKFVVHRPDRF